MSLSCDTGDLLPLDEALARLWEALPAPAFPELRADRDDPALDLATMDGAALRAAEGSTPRRLTGTLFAGDDPTICPVVPGSAVRIMTGAALPPGADAVVPVEQLTEEGGFLRPLVDPAPGDHIRRRGSQALAGEVILPMGSPVTAVRTGLEAWVGQPYAALRRIRVAVASTGDELTADPRPHQIRDANGPMLAALAHGLGAEVERWPALPDDPLALATALQNPKGIRILITSGGVSMGARDHLPAVLRDLGADVLFHRIRLRPGKPMLAALLGDLLVLGLPGNPGSAYLNARLFLPLALARLAGRRRPDPWRRGRLAAAVSNAGIRPLLQPCRREGDNLHPLPSKGSADLITLAQADACAWIEPGGLAASEETRWISIL
ncbi:molybdopterin molybdotransferase MoeA [Geothrix sp. 21YS21S-4]|uniref:molybdopterin molybdotransferase MoeA n=1 Tax=Geothrix sp. 21YS21S-4 TaxID=3068889 RepID=UPI0027B96B04|nr:molybdopterin molybdotransferase MoeA [Geothrix sp. 21YS21S-4]